jgi:hypothetical protein
MVSLLLRDGDISPNLGPTTNILKNIPTSFKQRQQNFPLKTEYTHLANTFLAHTQPMPPYIQSHSRIAAPNSTLITIKQPPHCPPHLYLIISISLLSQQCNRILKDRFLPRSLTILRCLKAVTTSLDALTTTCPILKEFSPQHGGGVTTPYVL